MSITVPLIASALIAVVASGISESERPLAEVPTPCSDAALIGSAKTAAAAGLPCNGEALTCTETSDAMSLSDLRCQAMTGDAQAAFVLGTLYATGTHVAEDAQQTELFWRLAAQRQHAEAQHALGMFLIGERAPRDDIDEGLFWLGSAASQGHATSAVVIGHLHEKGLHGVKPDVCLALDWYEAGAVMGLKPPEGYVEKLRATTGQDC
ncbi:MAG: tetratricopeptide repeat protein [Pseudomonadota bacterium]